ncbi:DUF4760 domain-containing protein [Alteromonas genovensis]|uniref:DUF4760 domain-containing protein n=1 Tax=Alteromonas genovensis TaxID=471225 RepID=A0A6N9TGP9_9ALTE|nr:MULTISPECIES: DUF4760 domain-containing protein [Alteromonas]MAI37737.1 hypothetical protein [Alteromonas sp.]NDW15652.1 DUF4760 domain-containing protein [Alteromonas genovensis]OUX87603.1 MAG: hypothetical protein CBB95_09135 [Alteromonas sp. TMED35]|tara:strand:+ start:3416 stop:3880 length:465 start_codon:yes stop_codon:yes gene_type:complete
MDAKTIILGISAAAAFIALYYNSLINKRKSTVELLLNQRNDDNLIKARKVVQELNKKEQLTDYAKDEHKGSDQRDSVLRVLNNYEFIATGMREGAFEIKIYKRMTYSQLCHDWKILKPFIMSLRANVNSATAFQEFEWLAKKFQSSVLKVDNKH